MNKSMKGYRMNRYFYFIPGMVMILCLPLFSCKGNPGPAGGPGRPEICVSFQDSVYPYAQYAGALDTYMDSSAAGANFGTAALLQAGFSASHSAEYRALLAFDLSYILPSDVNVIRAYLTLYADPSTAGSTTVTAYALTQDFSETSATWNSYDGVNNWAGPGADGNYAVSPVSGPQIVNAGTSRVVFTLDNIAVQNMIRSPAQYTGIMLKAVTLSGENYAVFDSRENSLGPEYGPELTVYYTLP